MVAVAAALFTIGVAMGALAPGPWSDTSLPPRQRAALLLKQMNLTEKINYVHGGCDGYVFNSCGVPRLGIPNMMAMDGPQGFRGDAGKSTAFPSGLTIGASFDVDAAREWGAAMGREFYQKGANVQLGPGACLVRAPLGGRAFEYISGEDSFLGYTMVQPVVQGIQSQGVVANVKHYVNNNQENNRNGVDVQVDERTQWELYYAPFQGAVDGGVGSVMCSLNRVGGIYACDNPAVLGRDLKQRMNFSGWVMSDWDGTHSSDALMAGLDQEMPHPNYLSTANVLARIKNGSVTEAKLEDTVMRILTPLISVGAFDRPANATVQPSANVTSPAHNTLARKLAAGSMVLLQNTGAVLPFHRASGGLRDGAGDAEIKNYALFSDQATAPIVGGTGSGAVRPYYKVSPAAALMMRLGFPDELLIGEPYTAIAPVAATAAATNPSAVRDTAGSITPRSNAPAQQESQTHQDLHQGPRCSDLFQNTDFLVHPSIELNGTTSSVDNCCAKCYAAGPSYYFFTRVPSGVCYCHTTVGERRPKQGYISGACRAGSPPSPSPPPSPPPPPPAPPPPSRPVCHGGYCVAVYPTAIGRDLTAVAAAVAAADAVIVFGATVSGEGLDRLDLTLANGGRTQAGQDDLIAAVGKAAKASKTPSVAVLVAPAALLTPWSDDVDAVIAAFMPGQEYGNALMDVLFGDTNPTARLPITYPNKENEVGFTQDQYPGPNPCTGGSPPCTKDSPVYYTEKLEVGYRWYHAHNVSPKFAFGHGLSYTTFAYNNITVVGSASVTVTLTNTGSVDGGEIPQLYIDFPPAVKEPPRQLKGFAKIDLEKGASREVTFKLTPRDKSIWNAETHGWEVASGTFTAHVGASSADLRLSASFTI